MKNQAIYLENEAQKLFFQTLFQMPLALNYLDQELLLLHMRIQKIQTLKNCSGKAHLSIKFFAEGVGFEPTELYSNSRHFEYRALGQTMRPLHVLLV